MTNKSNDPNTNSKRESVKDEELKKAMDKWNVSAPETVKQKSLAKAFEGIESAREMASKRRKVTQRRNWLKGLTATGVAVALMALIIVSTDFFQNGFFTPGDSPVPPEEIDENEQNEEQNNVNEGEREETENVNEEGNEENPEANENEGQENNEQIEDADDGYPDVDRSATTEVITNPEGMGEESNTYLLLNEDDFPFTTYIPEDNFYFERFSDDVGEGITISQDNGFMMMDVLFFNEEMTEEEALRYVEEELAGAGDIEELPREDEEDLPDWTIASYYYSGETFGRMTLGSYNGHLFYIYDEYIGDAADGWGPIKQVILDEWVWKETGEPL